MTLHNLPVPQFSPHVLLPDSLAVGRSGSPDSAATSGGAGPSGSSSSDSDASFARALEEGLLEGEHASRGEGGASGASSEGGDDDDDDDAFARSLEAGLLQGQGGAAADAADDDPRGVAGSADGPPRPSGAAAPSSFPVPPELLIHVLRFLSAEDLAAASAACRALREAAREPALWRSLFLMRWGAGLSPQERSEAGGAGILSRGTFCVWGCPLQGQG